MVKYREEGELKWQQQDCLSKIKEITCFCVMIFKNK